MKPHCPNPECSSRSFTGPIFEHIVRNGTFFRKSDSRRIARFFCKLCGRHFSRATFHPAYYQKCRRLTHALAMLTISSVTQRRAAILTGHARSTIVRRFRFLAGECRKEHATWAQIYREHPVAEVEFDDLETFEHTKCKPLSVALAVEPNTRKILGFRVSRMPANGRLSKISLRKYGPRKDERRRGWNQLLSDLAPMIKPDGVIRSDDNPHYPKMIKKHLPSVVHERVKGGRGAITGQGELKKLKFDPIFSLNHTCAMLRANLSRLVRKTWSTTKTVQGLIDHLSIYAVYHNQKLTPQAPSSAIFEAS